MKKNDFKIKHSELLQECMHMEDRLRGHYGLIKGKKDLDAFKNYTKQVNEKSLGQLVNKLKKLNDQYSEPFIRKLENATIIRNYYAHSVYYHHNPFNYDEVKKEDENKINKEYNYIKKINKELDNIYEKKLNKVRGNK